MPIDSHSPASPAQLPNSQGLAVIQARFGDRFQCSTDILATHARDVSHHTPVSPWGVVFPLSTAEIAEVCALCTANRIPIIPYGTGTAVEGGVVATQGGITVDLSRMKHVLRVSPGDQDATVQAGVTRGELNVFLENFTKSAHLFFPVDPGADASLGGMAATRASGSGALGYGTMRENVLGLTVVLADGRVIRTGGRARKSSAGYDLTRLFVGSEGTLGIIAEVTLRLSRRPQAIAAAVCHFADVDSAVRVVIEALGIGLKPVRAELLDEVQMKAVNQYSHLNVAEQPTLFLEFHGSERMLRESLVEMEEVARRHGSESFSIATDEAERKRLWQARYDGYYAALALRPGGSGYVTDVCVPLSELAGCIQRTRQRLQSVPIPSPLFGHVGDGNYHVVFVLDPNSAEELALVRELSDQIVEDAIAVGGTCSGEHGIGLGKIKHLEAEFGSAVDVMRSIKQALDPLGLMNPGKVLRKI